MKGLLEEIREQKLQEIAEQKREELGFGGR